MATAQVPLLNIVEENAPLRDQLLQALADVLDSGRFLYGPDVSALEQEMATLAGTEHAIACASGSDALLLAMLALEIGPDDEVIVPSFTFFATASCVWRVGATPVFADICPETFNLDPESVRQAISPATKALIPVHLFGQCADMEPLAEIARQHKLFLIEDAAQAIGATYQGQAAGSLGDLGCFSYYPTKNLGGMGDGGMLTTRDAELAERLRLFAAHGMQPRYHHQVVGINSRLDTFQAAVLRVKLTQLDAWNRQRVERAERYGQLLSDAGLDHWLGLPTVQPGCGHVWNQYTIRVPDGRREAVRQHLQQHGVGSEIYYPIPLHQQECFRSLGYEAGSLPETERAAAEVLSLPVSPTLTAQQQDHVVDALARFARRAAAA